MELSSLVAHTASTAVTDQFWPITAQVIPVLALAIILEARTAIQRWPNEVPKLARITNGVLWITPLALFAVVENVAFQILAGTTRSTGTWMLLAMTAIIFSISALIIAPTLELLVRSNAWAIVGGLFRIFSILSRRKMRQSLRFVDRLLVENRTNYLETIASLERLDTFEQRIHLFGDADSQEVQKMLAENEAVKAQCREVRAQLEEEEGLLFDWQTILQQGMKDTKKPDSELLKKIDQGLMLRGEFNPKEIKSLGQIKLPQDKLDVLNAHMEAFIKKHGTDK
jgi:hypothetical protein